MRIISDRSPKFSGGGYHFGSVWPLFTGWASVGEYRYHRAFPAYANLRANALLALDGSLGHVTEVLSGSYYQSLSTSSPHQIWSAAMVVSPLLHGLLGLETDAMKGAVTFAPHAPADWASFGIANVPVGPARLHLHYAKDLEGITLEVKAASEAPVIIDFQPAVSLRARVLGVELNGQPVPFRLDSNGTDQHVIVRITVTRRSNALRIRIQDDFGLSYSSTLPAMGATSQSLRILSETWTPARDRLTIGLSGLAGRQYELFLWNSSQVASVRGAKLVNSGNGKAKVLLQLPKNENGPFVRETISLQFVGKVAGPPPSRK
jgi:hypothetical protein